MCVAMYVCVHSCRILCAHISLVTDLIGPAVTSQAGSNLLWYEKCSY